MTIKVTPITSWQRVADAARFTVGKPALGHEPSEAFKRKMCLSEHSPLRLLQFDIRCYGIPYWVAMHLVRHHVGVEKFVSTQRTDRTGTCRDQLPQDAPVNLQLSINAQALIAISRVRLCRKAAPETRQLWHAIIEALRDHDPILARYCVPNCCYRGQCPEPNSCGLRPK